MLAFPDGLTGPAHNNIGKEIKEAPVLARAGFHEHGLGEGVATTVGQLPVKVNLLG